MPCIIVAEKGTFWGKMFQVEIWKKAEEKEREAKIATGSNTGARPRFKSQ